MSATSVPPPNVPNPQEDGFYWVKVRAGDRWDVGEWTNGEWGVIWDVGMGYPSVSVVGPHLSEPTPEEGAQDQARLLYNSMATPYNECAYDGDRDGDIAKIMDAINAAVAAEREACAKIAEKSVSTLEFCQPYRSSGDTPYIRGAIDKACGIAGAIRARSNV